MVKSETGSIYKDTFLYSFTPEKIILNPTWSYQYPPQQFDFKKIDDTSFQVESLYPGIPEEIESFMTYKK